ncbi:MAG: hypothetical protein ACLUFV_04185 [Acutalibacteraceae bacterium]
MRQRTRHRRGAVRAALAALADEPDAQLYRRSAARRSYSARPPSRIWKSCAIRCGLRPTPTSSPATARWERFRRTELIDKRRSGGYDTAELAALAAETARKAGSLLLVCNTRAQARTLYAALGAVWSGKRRHLSTSMCTKHRKAVLEDVCAALNAREPLICVTTQLIEAGVDVSFGSVIRILAGMDNAVQAAGRCNRSGEYGELRPVLLVNYRGENLSRLPEIYQAQQVCEDLLLRFERNPAAFDGRPDSESALNVYYTLLYKNANTDASEGPLSKGEPTLLELLSVNKGGVAKCSSAAQYTFRQAFRTAGDEFRVFDDHTQDVLVPYDGDGRAHRRARLGKSAARPCVPPQPTPAGGRVQHFAVRL